MEKTISTKKKTRNKKMNTRNVIMQIPAIINQAIKIMEGEPPEEGVLICKQTMMTHTKMKTH